MKYNLPKFIILTFFYLLISSCDKEEVIKPSADINEVIRSISKLAPPPPIQQRTETGRKVITETQDNINYTCTEVNYSLAQAIENVNVKGLDVLQNPNAADLWVGSIVQSKFVKDGILTSFGNFPREPITITINNLQPSSGSSSAKVNNPSNQSITDALNNLLTKNFSNANNPAKIVKRVVEDYSTNQAFLEMGIDYSWLVGSVGAKYNNSRSFGEKSVYIFFAQEYFTVSVPNPSSPADFFGKNTKVDDVKSLTMPDNPIAFVSSVTYGRLLIAKMTTKENVNYQELKLSVDIGLAGGNLNLSQKKTLENSEFTVAILGGDARQAAAIKKISDVQEFIEDGANFSSNSPGLPIAYTIKYLSDNSILSLGKATEFTTKDCKFDPASVQNFELNFNGFGILYDCDNGTLTNTGAGEFTYQIRATDSKGQILGSANIELPCSQRIDRNNDESILLNQIARFSLPKKAGEFIRIQGFLRENDNTDCTISELMAFDRKHNFPWGNEDIGNIYPSNRPNELWWQEFLNLRSDCQANLFYKIEKSK